MSPPARQPLLAILAVLAPLLLIAGIWIGGHPRVLPGFMRDVFSADHEQKWSM